MTPAQPGRQFSHRALFVIGTAAITAVLLVLLWYASQVLLLGFAGVLFGVLLHALAAQLQQRTRLPRGVSLAVTVLLLVSILGGAGWIAGAKLGEQGKELVKALPAAYDRLRDRAQQWPLVAAWMGGEAAPADQKGDGANDVAATQDDPTTAPASQPSSQPSSQPTSQPSTQPAPSQQLQQTIKDAAPRVASTIGTMVGSLVNALVSFVVVTVVGIYIAISPMTYAIGTVRLVPLRFRPRAAEVLATIVQTLRQWLVGQGITMLAIGVLTAGGLWIIGVKMWLLFGVLAALFNFIPNFGPLISFIPAVLVASAESGQQAAWVTGLYLVAQCFEGYVLTPLVQRESVDTPPAVLIVAQVLFGTLAGGLGLMLAAPLTAVALVMIKMLYVEDALDDKAEKLGKEPPIPEMVAKLNAALEKAGK